MDTSTTEIIQHMGDATQPIGEGHKIIAHICNDIGGWGKGFVLALRDKFGHLGDQSPEERYRQWFKTNKPKLGQVQFVSVSEDLEIANMIAQRDVITKNDIPPIRYDSLGYCLELVTEQALLKNASLHIPRIGVGLSGGRWTIINGLLQDYVISKGVQVHVYDLVEFIGPW